MKEIGIVLSIMLSGTLIAELPSTISKREELVRIVRLRQRTRDALAHLKRSRSRQSSLKLSDSAKF